MSDGQLFLFIFLLIYASDSVAWFGERGYLFVSYYGKRLSIRRHRFYFPGFQTGMAFLNPLPAFGQGYVTDLFPFSITEDGISSLPVENPIPISSLTMASQAISFLWEDINRISGDQKKLRINSVIMGKFSSVYAADFWVEQLRKLKSLESRELRNQQIGQLIARYLNEKRARQRLAIFQRNTRNLRISGTALFVIVFLLLPLVYIMFGESIQLLVLCLIMWVLMIYLAIKTYCLHRKFFPKAKAERVQHLILSIILPNIAIRSLDSLSKGFFCDTHLLALATAAAREKDLKHYRRSVARDVRHPIPIPSSGRESQITHHFRDIFFLPAMLEKLPEIDLLKAPETDLEGAAHCPRCLTPYDAMDNICEDCGGIPVVANLSPYLVTSSK